MIVRRLTGIAVLLAALVVWELWARHEGSFLVPPATRCWSAPGGSWPTQEFVSAVTGSLRRLAVGFALGSILGVALGVALGSFPRARRALEPLTELLRSLPPIALVPAAIVMLGLGDRMHIAVVAFGVLFPVLVNTMEGVRAIPSELRDTASMLHIGRFERLHRVYTPAALPSIVAGLRIALSIALVLVVVSEFAAGTGNGLGRYILYQQTQFNVPEMYGGILFLGLLGYGLNELFTLAERRLLHWRVGASGAHGR